MKRNFYLSIAMVGWALLTALPHPASAQEKEAVLIDRFDRGRGVPVPYAEGLRERVVRAFVDRGRHRVIDAQSIPALSLPAPGGGTEEERRAVWTNTGARYVISGRVDNYAFRHETVDGKPRFVTAMKLTLTGCDLQTGKEIAPEEFRLSGSGTTAEEADAKAFVGLPYSLLFYIDRRFKFETHILRLAPPDAKGRIKELYVRCGRDMGVQRKDLFRVYLETDMDGAVAREQIGKLRVKEVVGDEVTKCTVVKGGDEIAAAFAEGSTLVVVSDSESLF